MGKWNSSVTRVWPVFDHLLAQDPAGRTWLPTLLRLGDGHPLSLESVGDLLPEVSAFSRPIPRNLRIEIREVGCTALASLRAAFEADCPPSARFLAWLIEHPDRMKWPMKRGGSPQVYGQPTQDLRQRLFGGDAPVRAEALQALQLYGVEGSRRKWWAFEGWTSVDCWLETERLIVFIEGKRTESISASTVWFPARNQIARNLEVAAEIARQRGKDFAVLVCAERPVIVAKHDFDDSLPHLSASERDDLLSHYLGCATWQQIRDVLCPTVELPDDVDAAVKFCSTFRMGAVAK